jgi:hypothetical protein
VKGDSAQVALDAKLVTGLKSSIEVERRVAQLVGSDPGKQNIEKIEADESDAGESYDSTSLEDYLRIVHAEKEARGRCTRKALFILTPACLSVPVSTSMLLSCERLISLIGRCQSFYFSVRRRVALRCRSRISAGETSRPRV